MAASMKNKYLVTLLLENGADINASTKEVKILEESINILFVWFL